MKTVISASRRTDIPAFYMEWLMRGIQQGYFEVANPYNQRISVVPADPTHVHTIVLWSKNFEPFIAGDYGKQLTKYGYHLFFNFTINSESNVLEPGIPSLRKRLRQLEYLCENYDARAIRWRFDPICFYHTGSGEIKNNLNNFAEIAEAASALGIKKCITSFMDFYPKIKKRLAKKSTVSFIEIAMNEKISILKEMSSLLGTLGMELMTCCEQNVLDKLPEDVSVKRSACIPNDIIMDVYGGNISLKRDTGQRVKAGCGCMQSVDIGSYNRQPCYHNCLFCYANPKDDHES